MDQYKFYKLNYFKGNIGSYSSQAPKAFHHRSQLIKQTAEYVLEESVEKGGEENKNPRMSAFTLPLCSHGDRNFRYVCRNQNVIMAINYSIVIGTNMLNYLEVSYTFLRQLSQFQGGNLT